MNEIVLTKGQLEGVAKIEKFLKSDQQYFRLTGPPGSGKTFFIKYVLESYLQKERETGNMEVVGITLSHKAKNVLNRASIENCRTFANAYGFKEILKEDGSREFKASTFHDEPPVGHLPIPIFVHDEVSQYSYEMQRIMFKQTSLFSKVILMGDIAQLPPIDPTMKPDEDSPVLTFYLPDFCQHELKERVRQKLGHPILDLSDIMREEILGSQNLIRVVNEILKPKLNAQGHGFVCLQKNDLYHKYIQSTNFLENKIIAFRKFKVHEMNTQIRRMIFPYTEETIITGDLISMTNNFKNHEPYFKLMNSDEYIIQKVKKVMYQPSMAHLKIECYVAEVVSKYSSSYVVTPTPNGIDNYNKALQRLDSNGKQNKQLYKYKFEFIDSFSDFSMGYSVNAYKCQGSTYKNVFIDVMDILETKSLTPKRKLQTLFTALTRATDVAYFIKP